MEWLDKFFDMATGGLSPAAKALCPEHLKKQWLARLSDQNPFATIAANHDLVRATRLAWIEAAQEMLKEGRKLSGQQEWRNSGGDIERFTDVVAGVLLDARDLAFDRRRDPGASPIDAHMQAIIDGVPESLTPGGDPALGRSETAGFVTVLAQLSGWPAQEVPAVFANVAEQGLPTPGNGPRRPFGTLVFAAFAELIKDPKKYPQAREAFHIAMGDLARDLGRKTLAAVRGLDGRFEAMTAQLDGLSVMRDGAAGYLGLLPEIKAGVERIDARMERMDQAQAWQTTQLDEVLRRVANLESVPLDTLRAILAEMGEAVQAADAGEIERSLKAKAAEFRALTERLNRLSNDDPEVTRLRRMAAEALTEGRFDEADGHLATAEAYDLAGSENLEVLARQKRLSAAESRAQRAAAAMLRTNPHAYSEGASHYAEAARIAAVSDAQIARGYLQQQGLTLVTLGNDFGRNDVLRSAIEHFRLLLTTSDRENNPSDWAVTQNNLGAALTRIGERESGEYWLEEAIIAFRAAWEEHSRGPDLLKSAVTQNNLGHALCVLGQRENGTARLEEAVLACRAALEGPIRQRAPLDWAMAQSNLGNALAVIGGRKRSAVWLEQAINAYRSALEERTRDRVPLDWATSQGNLGNALRGLGQLEDGTTRLVEAVTAYRAALQEQTRERLPRQWAITQNNLGNALRGLGERESGTVRLEEAVSAYSAALEEQTREQAPLEWAMSLGNRGVTIGLIAERRVDLSLARDALKQVQTAYDTFEGASHAPYAARAKRQAGWLEALIRRMDKG